jgi:hypothetical protein
MPLSPTPINQTKKAVAFVGRGFVVLPKKQGPSREGPRHIFQLPVDIPHEFLNTRHQHQIFRSLVITIFPLEFVYLRLIILSMDFYKKQKKLGVAP